jgi:hypothetical protein
LKEEEKKAFKVVEKLKSIDLIVQEVETDAVFVNLDGWRMRVYFAEGFKGNAGKGSIITVGYRGDIENPHSVKFEKLK